MVKENNEKYNFKYILYRAVKNKTPNFPDKAASSLVTLSFSVLAPLSYLVCL